MSWRTLASRGRGRSPNAQASRRHFALVEASPLFYVSRIPNVTTWPAAPFGDPRVFRAVALIANAVWERARDMIPAGADPDLASVASETTTSASPAKDGPPANDVPKRRGLVQPPWLKPAVVIGVTTAHIVVMAALSLVLIELVTPVADIAVELMPEGETVTEVSVIPTPDAASVVSQDQSNATSPDPPSSRRCRRSGGHDGDGADGDSAGNRPVAAEDHGAGLRSSAASKQERKKKHRLLARAKIERQKRQGAS